MQRLILIPMVTWGLILILILILNFSLPRTVRLPQILGRMIKRRLCGQKAPTVVFGDWAMFLRAVLYEGYCAGQLCAKE